MQAEKAVLGTMIKEPHLINETRLHPDHFELIEHKEILRAMKELSAKGKGIDVVTLITYFNPQIFGGANYVSDMLKMANEKRFEQHASAVLDSYREREKKNVIEIAKEENWSIDQIVTELDKLQDDEIDDHSEIMQLTVDVYEAPYQKVDIQSGANTGLEKLNEMTNGLQNSELTILAARPSMGRQICPLFQRWYKQTS